MATIQEMIGVAGSIEAAEKMARQLGELYVLDHQLCLAAQGKWKEAKRVNASRPKRNGREHYAAGLYSVMDDNLPKGVYEFHQGRGDGLFGSRRMLPGALFTPSTDIAGKTVLMTGEGGLGDQVINVRFAKTLADRGAKAIVSCDKSLMPVFSRIDGVSAVLEIGAEHGAFYDYWMPSMSAPGLLKVHHKDLSGKPFLSALDDKVAMFGDLMGKKSGLRIGVKWVGNPEFEHEQFRRFPPELLFNAVKGHDVWSMDISQPCPDGMKDASVFMRSWDDTLGALSNIDLLITSCTSMAHVAGALGISTWVVVPVMPYYTWAYPIDASTSHWYDSVRLFRQEKFDCWEAPFAKLKKELALLTAEASVV